MNKPDYLEKLIDLASKAAGNASKLAENLEVSRQTVSDWKHGRKPCPAGDVALMAEIAGMEPTVWTCRAVAAQYEGTEKGKRLREALKKALVATGAALVSSGAQATAAAVGKAGKAAKLLYTMYKHLISSRPFR